MKTIAALTGLILLVPSLAWTQESFQYEEKIKSLVQPYVKHEKVMAVSVGVVLNGKTWTGNFGRLSKENPSPPTADTLYEIGSITKVFTSLLLADEVTRGELELDQPIGTLLPNLDSSNPDVAKSITLKHLSTHMSGLPRTPTNLKLKDANQPFAGYDRKMMYDFMKSFKPWRKPGWGYEYSNLGAGLLAELISEKNRKSYEQLLKERIFNSLKMKDSTISLSPQHKKRLAPPHDSALLPNHVWDFGALNGCGAIRSTANDMTRFMQAVLEPNDERLGKPIDLTWKQHLSASMFGRKPMGLGWVFAGDKSTRWHNGQTGGYHSMMLVNRELNAGVVVLTNTAELELDQMAESIFQAVCGVDVQPKTFDKIVKVEPAYLKRLEGDYALTPDVTIHIQANKDKLRAQLTGQQAFQVFPKNKTTWNYRVVKAQLRFEVPESGPATKVTLHQNGRKTPAPRIKK